MENTLDNQTHNSLKKQVEKYSRFKGKIAFTAVVDENGNTIGIAEKGTRGYTPTYIPLPENYNVAKAHVEKLNKEVLEIEPLDAIMIVAETMRS